MNAGRASAVVTTLLDSGVKDLVVSPGGRSTALVVAAAELGMRLHIAVDERAGGFFALGLSRGGRRAALLCTSGSAAGHYLPALIEASESQVGLVVLTADRPPELMHAGAPQATIQDQLYGAHVRWSARADGPPEACATLTALAVDRAFADPRGPVHLNIPFRKPLWMPDAEAPVVRRVAVLRGPLGCAAPVVAAVAERVTGRRGVIVCGPHGDVSRQAVLRLARRLAWPVVASAESGLRFGACDGVVVVACAHGLLGEGCESLRPEVALRFGRVPVSGRTQRWLAEVPALLVSPSGTWTDPEHVAETLVVAEPDALCDALAQSDVATAAPSWAQLWRTADAAASATVADQTSGEGCWGGAVARRVLDALPGGASVHVSSSMAVRDLDTFGGNPGRDIGVFCSRGVNGVDGTLATAAGEAVAQPRRPMLVLLGDLALRHDIGGLMLAAELGVRLTVVVVDNQGGGIFSHLPVRNHADFEAFFVTRQTSDLLDLARAAGARTVDAADLSGLGRAVAADLERPGVGVIRVRTDREGERLRRDQALLAVDAVVQEILNNTGACS